MKTPQALEQIPKHGYKIHIDFSYYGSMLCLNILVHVLEGCDGIANRLCNMISNM